jgi:SAM-dependent methyltransferase
MSKQHTQSCPICTSTKTQKIINWGLYAIKECYNCGLIFSDPMPSREFLNHFYQGFSFNVPDKKNIRKLVDKRKLELETLFDCFGAGKYFLDYGGGSGSAFKAARELKLVPFYHDLDIKAEAFVRKQFGLTSDYVIEDISKTTARFDYIFSDNVMEHLVNPIENLKEMRNILHSGGVIVIKTPHARNTESYFYPMITIYGYLFTALKFNPFFTSLKAYCTRFWHCDPPRHPYSFSKKI